MSYKNPAEFDKEHDRASALVIGDVIYFKDGVTRTNEYDPRNIVMHEPLQDADEERGRRRCMRNRMTYAEELVNLRYKEFRALKQRLFNENSNGKELGSGPPPITGLSELRQLQKLYNEAVAALEALKEELSRDRIVVADRRRQAGLDAARGKCDSYSAQLHRINIGDDVDGPNHTGVDFSL